MHVKGKYFFKDSSFNHVIVFWVSLDANSTQWCHGRRQDDFQGLHTNAYAKSCLYVIFYRLQTISVRGFPQDILAYNFFATNGRDLQYFY